MRRLARLQHGIVGRIHHIIDASHADRFETLDHPVGRGPYVDALDDARRIPPAQIRFVDLHLRELRGLSVHFLQLDPGQLQFLACGRGQFPRHPDMAQAIPTSARHLNIEHNIVWEMLDPFAGKAQIAQDLRHRFGAKARLDIVIQPIQRNLHEVCPYECQLLGL